MERCSCRKAPIWWTRRLTLKSEMTLKLSDDAILKAIPNDSKKYSVLSISGVSNVAITGGTLEGERDQHKGEKGEWGMVTPVTLS